MLIDTFSNKEVDAVNKADTAGHISRHFCGNIFFTGSQNISSVPNTEVFSAKSGLLT